MRKNIIKISQVAPPLSDWEKDIVKKPTPAVSSTLPAMPGETKPVNHSNITSKQSNAITEMQQAIINFANTIYSTKDEAQKTTEEKDKDNFASSLVSNLEAAKNTLTHIGSPGSSIDGVWMSKTNNALIEVANITDTILNLAKKDNLTASIQGVDYNTDEFRKLIPDSYTKIKGSKDELAVKLTEQIKNATEIFNVLRNAIKKNNINQITQELVKEQTKEDKDPSKLFNDNEKEIFKTHSVAPIPGTKINGVNLTLNDLLNKDNFYNFMKKINKDPNNQVDVQETLKEISNSLNGKVQPQTANVPASLAPTNNY